MTKISERLRRLVTLRAQGVCEYRQTQKRVITQMNIDHIVPVSAGGLDTEDNLCLSCWHCNTYKSDIQQAHDPQTGNMVPLFNPRTDTWNDHFQWSQDFLQIIGISATGRATVEQLWMNDPDIISSRKLWVSVGWHPPKLEDPSS